MLTSSDKYILSNDFYAIMTEEIRVNTIDITKSIEEILEERTLYTDISGNVLRDQSGNIVLDQSGNIVIDSSDNIVIDPSGQTFYEISNNIIKRAIQIVPANPLYPVKPINLVDNYYIVPGGINDTNTIRSIFIKNIKGLIFNFLNETTSETIEDATKKWNDQLKQNCTIVYIRCLVDIDNRLTDLEKKSLMLKNLLTSPVYRLLDTSSKLKDSVKYLEVDKFLAKFIADNPNLTITELNEKITDGDILQLQDNISNELLNPSFPSNYL
jgi:hypothetical protein